MAGVEDNLYSPVNPSELPELVVVKAAISKDSIDQREITEIFAERCFEAHQLFRQNPENQKTISRIEEAIYEAYQKGGQVISFGNGGSGNTHIAGDERKSWNYFGPRDDPKNNMMPTLRVLNGFNNLAFSSAIANDLKGAYEEVFIEELYAADVKPGDVVMGSSGSGTSKNVLKAIDYANKQGAITVGITTYDGGELLPMVKYGILVPSAPFFRDPGFPKEEIKRRAAMAWFEDQDQNIKHGLVEAIRADILQAREMILYQRSQTEQ